jgi:hypothetical protein
VSFAAPLVLLGLLALPALVVWYAAQQRDRRRAAAPFAAPRLAASVTPHRPGWRRHAPLLAVLLALALYTATDAERLRAVYEHLGSQLGHKNEKRQITTRFAGAAVALLLLGAAMSLHWFGRLI